jgi:flagellar basal-body rod modification protein FlgD
MTIHNTAPVGSVADTMAAATRASSPVPAAKDQWGQDTFLKLLVAQLRYQDPTNPTDGAEFLAQTAQFTSLEKLGTVADLSAELLAAQRVLGASSLVGQTVTYTKPAETEGGLPTEVTGVVTSARFETDGTVLLVDGASVPMAQVKEVRRTT